RSRGRPAWPASIPRAGSAVLAAGPELERVGHGHHAAVRRRIDLDGVHGLLHALEEGGIRHGGLLLLDLARADDAADLRLSLDGEGDRDPAGEIRDALEGERVALLDERDDLADRLAHVVLV